MADMAVAAADTGVAVAESGVLSYTDQCYAQARHIFVHVTAV